MTWHGVRPVRPILITPLDGGAISYGGWRLVHGWFLAGLVEALAVLGGELPAGAWRARLMRRPPRARNYTEVIEVIEFIEYS